MKQNNKETIKHIPFCLGVELLTCDYKTTLFALNKPEGVKSHPNNPGIDKKSLILAPYDLEEECYSVDISNNQIVKVYLLNRLDSPTSGIILLCLDPDLALEIRYLFKIHKISKTYLAAVKGLSHLFQGTWKDPLISEKNQEKIRTQRGGGRIAETKFQFLSQNKSFNISLLKLNPITGFTHQLRVQSALHKHPILGDKTYGDFSFNKTIQKQISFKRLFLHSSEINFNYSYQGNKFTFKAYAKTPKEFEVLFSET